MATKKLSRHMKDILHTIDYCAHCKGTLKVSGGIKGVKAGFGLVHAACAPEYQEALEAREKARQAPSWGIVTVLPDCLNTEGYYNWVEGGMFAVLDRPGQRLHAPV